jgi:hypothetical protein
MAQSAEQTTAAVDTATALEESIYLQYSGNVIPWYVRLIWIIFWCGAIAYVVTWYLPAIQSELLAPP